MNSKKRVKKTGKLSHLCKILRFKTYHLLRTPSKHLCAKLHSRPNQRLFKNSKILANLKRQPNQPNQWTRKKFHTQIWNKNLIIPGVKVGRNLLLKRDLLVQKLQTKLLRMKNKVWVIFWRSFWNVSWLVKKFWIGKHLVQFLRKLGTKLLKLFSIWKLIKGCPHMKAIILIEKHSSQWLATTIGLKSLK